MPPVRATGGIDITIIGDDKGVQKMLRGLDTAFSPVGMAAWMHSQMGPYLQQRAKLRFKSEGDDVVGKWAPLSPATQAIRAGGPWAVGPAHPINIRTHQLEDYVTGDTGNVMVAGLVSTLTFPDPARARGDVRKKMKVAQQGQAPRTPARPVIGLGVQDLAFAVASLAFYAETVASGMRARSQVRVGP